MTKACLTERTPLLSRTIHAAESKCQQSKALGTAYQSGSDQRRAPSHCERGWHAYWAHPAPRRVYTFPTVMNNLGLFTPSAQRRKETEFWKGAVPLDVHSECCLGWEAMCWSVLSTIKYFTFRRTKGQMLKNHARQKRSWIQALQPLGWQRYFTWQFVYLLNLGCGKLRTPCVVALTSFLEDTLIHPLLCHRARGYMVASSSPRTP